jgi:methyltransferase (TIGR00027 family)
MRDADTPSNTALLVAVMRRWSKWLPPPLCALAPDPLGAALAGGAYARVDACLEAWPRLARLLFLWAPLRSAAAGITLRTRCLDDAVRAFVAAGDASPGRPRQVLLLGAGMDARAWRLDALRDCAVFEVDSPGSQRAKRAALARLRLSPPPRLTFVAHDFEGDHALAALPAKLVAAGLDAAAPTLTLWEGVAVYLPVAAVDDTLRMLRRCGGAGSQLAFTYQEPRAEGGGGAQARRSLADWVVRAAAARAGERFRTFFHAAAMPAWLQQRGCALLWDKRYADVAADVAPGMRAADVARLRGGARMHFALAAVTPAAAEE